MNAFLPPLTPHVRRNETFVLRAPLSAIGDSRVFSKRRCGKANAQRHDKPFVWMTSSTPSAPQEGFFSKLWDTLTVFFPVWTVAAAAIALAQPGLFSGLTRGDVMRRMLSLLMLSTGLTLTGRELVETRRRPWTLLFSLLSCYGVMPALAFMLMKVFGLSGGDGAGLLLLGVVSGGQTSNLCTLIAGGDVALSVAMTTLTSVASVVAIPSLSTWLLGQTVDVNALAVAQSTLELVAVPLIVGAGINTLFPNVIRRLKGILPVVGIGAVLVLILGPVADMSGVFFSSAQRLALPVVLLHLMGGLIGFVVPKMFGSSRKTAVTTAFESGFKSPVLSYVLAQTHFGAGVGMASVVSIVVLAPLAAVFAVMVRLFWRRGMKVVKVLKVDGASDVIPWKGYVGGGDEAVMDNTRMMFRVVGVDGTSTIVGYEQLRIVLDRARRRGGVRRVERVTLK